jgi:lipopolysaccharide export system permease protein
MTRLDRYVLVQTLGAMVFVTIVLSAAIWLAQSLRLIDLIVNKGLSLAVFLYLVLLVLPRFLDVVLPIALFIAVLFTYAKLTAESELVVMRAAGIGPVGLARPALLLTGGAVVLIFVLSAWLLPAATRAFKDLQFEVRHQFVAAVVQEGTFTPLSDNMTVYVRARESNGELLGLLVQDEREKGKPVTITAERGMFVDTPTGPRVVMLNGSRQQLDSKTNKLSMLSFERYTLDLGDMRDSAGSRLREPRERSIEELWLGPDDMPGVRAERHQRLTQPVSALAFALIPLACLLGGQFNRRGQARRVLLAVGLVFFYEAIDLGFRNVAQRVPAAITLMYAWAVIPAAVSWWLLSRDERVGVPLAQPAAS